MHTTILTNAIIHTMAGDWLEASSLAIQNGRVTNLYSGGDGIPSRGPKVEIQDMGGRTVLPGLCDSHLHLQKYAQMIHQVDCETETLSHCLEKVKERIAHTPPGEWVLGHGWNQNTWGGYGSLDELDAISPDHPVYLTAKSLHAGWANSRALSLAGLSSESPDPPKGKLGRDAKGQLTGILFENALLLVSGIIPKPEETALEKMILNAQERLHRWGITAVHDFDGVKCLRALSNLEQRDQLGLRVLKHIREVDFSLALEEGFKAIYQGDWLRIGSLKLFADGALGPRTAAMLESYDGEPGNSGMLLYSKPELIKLGLSALEAQYPMAIHAIGDQANRTVLDALEELSIMTPDPLPYAHRIEHVQLLHPSDIPRLAKLGVIASMQPIHAVSDHEMADRYWGDRVRYSYAWKSQFAAGAHVIFGSDAPVESPNPWSGIFAALTRCPLVSTDAAAAWVPEERVTIKEALRAFTINPAQRSPWQNLIGQLSPGYAADLIALELDPLKINADEIKDLSPCGVMVDGNWVIREF